MPTRIATSTSYATFTFMTAKELQILYQIKFKNKKGGENHE